MKIQAFVAEAFGTFSLVFAGTGAIVVNDATAGGVTHVGVALTFGLIVMAMIYAVGDVSGAHLNPAVSLGFVLAGRLRLRSLGWYVLSQMIGAFSASAVVLCVLGHKSSLGATLPAGSDIQSFVLELVLTAILMFVILRVSTASKEAGLMAGIAVGGVVGLEAMFAGPISGASMNPARSLAPALLSGNFTSLWVYLTAPFAGSVSAVAFWKVTLASRRDSPRSPGTIADTPPAKSRSA
jgi:aquaporin Z